MRYLPCLNTSTIRPAPLLTKIDAAGRAGFRAVELWNADVTAYLEQGGAMEDIRRALATHGLHVPSVIAITGFVGNDAPGREERLAEARRRMRQARELGAPFIVASPPPGRTDVARCARDYAELLEIGREIGVRPAMEFLGFVEQVNSIAAAREIMERSGDPTATLVIDWFHMVRGSGRDTMLEDLRALAPEQIAIVHLDDVPYRKPFAEMTDGDRVYPGDGDIPLDDLFAVLGEIGYRGPVSVELFNAELWGAGPVSGGAHGVREEPPLAGVSPAARRADRFGVLYPPVTKPQSVSARYGGSVTARFPTRWTCIPDRTPFFTGVINGARARDLSALAGSPRDSSKGVRGAVPHLVFPLMGMLVPTYRVIATPEGRRLLRLRERGTLYNA